MNSMASDKTPFPSSRIFLDLSNFFKDHRKYCCLYLDTCRFKTVSDVKRHCAQHFSIVGDLQLLLDDCLLLENDSVQVLRDGDYLRLVNPESYANGETEKSVNAQVQQSNGPLRSKNITTAACHTVEGSPLKSAGKNKKTRNADSQAESTSTMVVNEVVTAKKTGVSERLFGKIINEDMPSESSKQNGVPNESGEQDMDIVCEGEVNWDLLPPLPKRKRNRRKKNKKAATDPVDTPPSEIIPGPAPVVVKQHPNRLHIRFEENILSSDTVTDYSQQQTEVSEPEDVQNTSQVDFCDLLTRKSPVVYQRPRIPEQKNEEWVQLTEGEIWENPAVTEPPKVDDIIAFKVLCLGVDYTPQLSPWIIGKVTMEQTDNNDLKLTILRGINPFIRDMEGKFETGDVIEDQDKNNISIPWKEMVTARKLKN